jgi:hypothetical protein
LQAELLGLEELRGERFEGGEDVEVGVGALDRGREAVENVGLEGLLVGL